jgi:hypothetical protein
LADYFFIEKFKLNDCTAAEQSGTELSSILQKALNVNTTVPGLPPVHNWWGYVLKVFDL